MLLKVNDWARIYLVESDLCRWSSWRLPAADRCSPRLVTVSGTPEARNLEKKKKKETWRASAAPPTHAHRYWWVCMSRCTPKTWTGAFTQTSHPSSQEIIKINQENTRYPWINWKAPLSHPSISKCRKSSGNRGSRYLCQGFIAPCMGYPPCARIKPVALLALPMESSQPSCK